jgi:hypothetical protein
MMEAVSGQLLPPPHRLVALFESGRITRAQLQEAMSCHQRDLLSEIEQARRNPLLAYFDEHLSRYLVARLERNYGELLIRQVLAALSNLAGFPPANLLWNAGHRDVPLHCFFRIRREPVFRLVQLETGPLTVSVTVEHGKASKRLTTREEFLLHRDRFGNLVAGVRRM